MTRQTLTLVAVTCGLSGLYGWAVFISTFGHDGSIGPRYNAPGTDWMVFYAAARAYLEGNLPLIFDGHGFTAYQNAMFADKLSRMLPFHPWLYPPHYLLLALPFSLIPFSSSYALFMAVTAAALAVALWLYGGPGHRKWPLLASLALCPASSLTVIAGQNAFLTGALLVGGFGLLARHPGLAGILLGAASIKPTLWLMVPIALVAARQWRALTSAAATAGLLALASLAVFGVETWRLWLEMMVSPAADFYGNWLESGRSWGLSVYTCAWVLGASHGVANFAQATATLAAGVSVFLAFRRPLTPDLQLAVLLAAAILAAPHVSSYDALLLAIAAGLLFCRALDEGAPLYLVTLMLAGWLLPLINPPRATPLGLLTPLIVTSFILCAMSGTPARSSMRAVAAE
ncbi:MAG TPA: glycosyltransferase family 87 protein [Stellaceae bacterium]